jgi:hypothetical protein
MAAVCCRNEREDIGLWGNGPAPWRDMPRGRVSWLPRLDGASSMIARQLSLWSKPSKTLSPINGSPRPCATVRLEPMAASEMGLKSWGAAPDHPVAFRYRRLGAVHSICLLDQNQRPVIILIGAPRIVSGNPTTVPSVLPAACCLCDAEAGFTAMFFSSTGTSRGAISASWANLL